MIPSDRTIVVERFRDEIGDWRLCVLSPYGGRVHAAWALALSARLRDELGLESDAIWSDDGIIVHLPDADEPPGAGPGAARPRRRSRTWSSPSSASSALFGARFRENAGARAADPARLPGPPHAAVAAAAEGAVAARGRQALRATSRSSSRPTASACATCSTCPGLQELLTKLHTRELSLVEVETPTASPFASVAAVRLRRDVHVRGRHAERRAARGRAVARPRPAARAARPGGAARPDRPGRAGRASRTTCSTAPSARAPASSDALARRAAPRRRPDRRGGAGRACCAGLDAAALPRHAARASGARSRVRIGGEERWIAADDAGLYRDALGAVPPGGLPEAFLEAVERPLEELLRRYARTHGPFTTAEVARALRRRRLAARSTRSSRAASSSAASCARPRRRARVVRPRRAAADPARVARRAAPGDRGRRPSARSRAFLPGWQGVDRHPPAGAGVDRLREALVPLQGLALPADVWERDVLPRRVGAYSPAWMDQLTASGEVVWVGAGALGRNSGRVALYFRDDAAAIGRPGDARAGDRAAAGRPSTRRSASGSPPRRASSPTCSPSSRPSPPRSCRRGCGTSSGRARRPTTRSRRCARRA